ncbi:MAG: bifunctional metallophosphatase/5'-nucleotidase [Deltaproteobacteria bacterium]|nr:bifunctional metallophosphatase/5'-nucleotidase [Deltaproteobacteria bacterium]
MHHIILFLLAIYSHAVCSDSMANMLWHQPLEPQSIELFHTNDLHGTAAIARIVTVLKKLTADRSNVLWVDAGDFNGSDIHSLPSAGLHSWLTMKEAADLIPHVRPLIALGNHDADTGMLFLNNFLARTPELGFKVLAANLTLPKCQTKPHPTPPTNDKEKKNSSWPELGKLFDWLKQPAPKPTTSNWEDFRKPVDEHLCSEHGNFDGLRRLFSDNYVIEERNGIRVALIGLTHIGLEFEGAYWPAKRFDPLTRLSSDAGDDSISFAQKLINEVRSQKVDAVGILSHLGYKKDQELISKTDVDFVIGGHDHYFVSEEQWPTNLKGRKIPYTQLGRGGNRVGWLKISKQAASLKYRYQIISLTEQPDEQMVKKLDLLQSHLETTFPRPKQITKDSSLFETPLGVAALDMQWYKNRECLANNAVVSAFSEYGSGLVERGLYPKSIPLALSFPDFSEFSIRHGTITLAEIFNWVPRLDFVTGEIAEVWSAELDGKSLLNLLRSAATEKWLTIDGARLLLDPNFPGATPFRKVQTKSIQAGVVSFEDIDPARSYLLTTFSTALRVLPVLVEKFTFFPGSEPIKLLSPIHKSGVSVTELMANYVQKKQLLDSQVIGDKRFRVLGHPATVLVEAEQPATNSRHLRVRIANLGEKPSLGCQIALYASDELAFAIGSQPLVSPIAISLEGDVGLAGAVPVHDLLIRLPLSAPAHVVAKLERCPAHDYPAEKTLTMHNQYKELLIHLEQPVNLVRNPQN